MLVPWRIAIINGEFARHTRRSGFTAEETDVLVRAIKDREVTLYGDGRNPSKLALVRRAWEEIATIVSTAGIPRTMRQGINASLDRVVMLLRPLRRIASILQTHPPLLLCPFLLLPQLHLCPPAPLGAHRALPLPDPHGYGRRVAYQREKELVLLFKSFSAFFLYSLQKWELLPCNVNFDSKF